ncbi:hypothetical protein M1M06_28980, partial [Ralstonia insidiosa]|uniref:hypothetical protein n=1 Tax=Ralstonia insidiosa TaxID=190721 RepID=UPI00200B3856
HETARFCIKRTTAAKLLNFQVTDLKRKFRRNRQILREKDDYPVQRDQPRPRRAVLHPLSPHNSWRVVWIATSFDPF